MRKLVVSMKVTLDGYVSGPKGELGWLFRTADPTQDQRMTQWLHEVDTVLLGHTTYLEQASYWPKQPGEMAELLNNHAKVVFSRSLHALDWNNSRLAIGSLADEVANLKQQPGRTIYASGGATLIHSLTELGLVDEYHLDVHPVILGGGKSLFATTSMPGDLALTGAITCASGVIQLSYQRPDAAS